MAASKINGTPGSGTVAVSDMDTKIATAATRVFDSAFFLLGTACPKNAKQRNVKNASVPGRPTLPKSTKISPFDRIDPAPAPNPQVSRKASRPTYGPRFCVPSLMNFVIYLADISQVVWCVC